MMDFLLNAVVIGIGGTAAMDLWALLLRAVFGLPLPNWGLVGRWFAHLAKGTFFHKDITAAEAVPNEAALGWFSHYAIGILYAGILIWFAGPGWLVNPTFLPAWILGLVTLILLLNAAVWALQGGQLAWETHLGGFLTGLAVALLWRRPADGAPFG